MIDLDQIESEIIAAAEFSDQMEARAIAAAERMRAEDPSLADFTIAAVARHFAAKRATSDAHLNQLAVALATFANAARKGELTGADAMRGKALLALRLHCGTS